MKQRGEGTKEGNVQTPERKERKAKKSRDSERGKRSRKEGDFVKSDWRIEAEKQRKRGSAAYLPSDCGEVKSFSSDSNHKSRSIASKQVTHNLFLSEIFGYDQEVQESVCLQVYSFCGNLPCLLLVFYRLKMLSLVVYCVLVAEFSLLMIVSRFCADFTNHPFRFSFSCIFDFVQADFMSILLPEFVMKV